MLGVRLDSGDLAALSLEARRLLDEAGFQDARIYASNDLDEHVIESLKAQGAAIAVWGVGTRLVTAHDDPALGGVYKLSAVRRPGEPWRYKVKLSEQLAKSSTPGVLQVRRFSVDGRFVADGIYDEASGWRGEADRIIIDPLEMTRRTHIPAHAAAQELLVPALRAGKRVLAPEPLDEARRRAAAGLESLPAGVRRFLNPHLYPVGLEPGLHELKLRMLLEARRPKS
jgi:nicotinate phosphoribosyltransferase